MTLSSVPVCEHCSQVGQEDYLEQTRIELNAYRNQLRRQFITNPLVDEDTFKIKGFPHDFGMYHELVILYYPDTEEEAFAFEVEANLPENWDEEAIVELKAKGYRHLIER